MVLGGPAGMALVGAELEKLGFEALSLESFSPRLRLPEPGQTGWIQKTREVFKRLKNLDLVHPGVTSWGDRPEFFRLVTERGWIPITPSPALKTLGLYLNKLHFLEEAEMSGVRTLLLTSDPIHSLREIKKF